MKATTTVNKNRNRRIFIFPSKTKTVVYKITSSGTGVNDILLFFGPYPQKADGRKQLPLLTSCTIRTYLLYGFVASSVFLPCSTFASSKTYKSRRAAKRKA
jgi:hypothetical protein